MHITVIGTGYVGLVAGACFADKGYDVCCVDIDQKKIDRLNSGQIPIYEPGLKEIVERAVKREHLIFTTDLKMAFLRSTVAFICVGTPEDVNGKPNMTAVWAVTKSIAQIAKENLAQDEKMFKVIVTKSTVPVGTGDKITQILTENGISPEQVAVASNPEFLKEGDAINDFVKPDRVIIGSDSQQARDLLVEIYTPFTRKSERMILMDIRSAELTKYGANSMLALRITFMNQLAALCEKLDADISSVRKGIGSDTRIGSSFLFPGPGYGGSCFPKDVKALIELGRDNETVITIMESVDVYNQQQKHLLSKKAISYFSSLNTSSSSSNSEKTLEGKTIGVWGLAFKPETDDIRESPSLYVIRDLINAGAHIKAYDPEAMETFRAQLDDAYLTFCSTMYDAVKACDALIVVTDWNEFKMPDFEKMSTLMRGKVIIDGRNLYNPRKLRDLGYYYEGIGRKKN